MVVILFDETPIFIGFGEHEYVKNDNATIQPQVALPEDGQTRNIKPMNPCTLVLCFCVCVWLYGCINLFIYIIIIKHYKNRPFSIIKL